VTKPRKKIPIFQKYFVPAQNRPDQTGWRVCFLDRYVHKNGQRRLGSEAVGLTPA
jgi:hypothetical protein